MSAILIKGCIFEHMSWKSMEGSRLSKLLSFIGVFHTGKGPFFGPDTEYPLANYHGNGTPQVSIRLFVASALVLEILQLGDLQKTGAVLSMEAHIESCSKYFLQWFQAC